LIEYLVKSGYDVSVAKRMLEMRPDIAEGGAEDMSHRIPPKDSRYRPFTYYRGIRSAPENYRSDYSEGQFLAPPPSTVLPKVPTKWLTNIQEVAMTFLPPRATDPKEQRRFRSTLLEYQLPYALIAQYATKGTSVKPEDLESEDALGIRLEGIPDDAPFIRRMGTVDTSRVPSLPGEKASGMVGALVWFPYDQVFKRTLTDDYLSKLVSHCNKSWAKVSK